MGTDNFPSRKDIRADKGDYKPAEAKDWLDRANDVFHFENAISGRNLPPLDIPADLIPPAFAPKVKPEVTQATAPAPVVNSVEASVAPLAATHIAETVPQIAREPMAPRARDWSGQMQPLNREGMAEGGYLLPDAPVDAIGEEFRLIKRELLSHIRGSKNQVAIKDGNVILVTSAHSGDGKTYCAINLAVAMAAEAGLDVLLVDADFAKPSVMKALGLTAERGLMDALADSNIAVEDLVIRTDVPSLSVLPAGQGSEKDNDLIGSSRMKDIIASLASGRDNRIILFDTPPLLAASAASMLAAYVGQAIMVVRADKTTESALRESVAMLKECDCVQLLLNAIKFSTSGRRYGYYGKEGE